jgi:4'-phosphopantetheinyl transferase
MPEASLSRKESQFQPVHPNWPSARPGKGLKTNEIQVWSACLDQPETMVTRLLETLSADERARADRFLFYRDRRRFIVGRGALRILLGSYAEFEPSFLQLGQGEYGKPLLKNPPPGGLRFNISHSGGLGLFAFVKGREVGVDLEFIRPMPDADAVSERFFSPRERAVLRDCPQAQKSEAFFRCWTRKEAFIKAIGQGLSHPLDRFDVSLAPGESARFLAIDEDTKIASRWLLRELNPAPGYLGALAIEGRDWHLTCLHYHEIWD